MRLGFLGGSFDPIHCGHLQAALIAAEEARLDKVYLLPTGRNWQKAPTIAPIEKRLDWAARVAQTDERLGILDTDIREGAIYAIDTAALLRSEFPRAELFWIIGGDQLANLHTWHQAAKLVKELGFFVLMRENYPFIQPQLPGVRLLWAHRQPILTSSTRLRSMIAKRQNVGGLLPPCVADDITAFYQCTPDGEK